MIVNASEQPGTKQSGQKQSASGLSISVVIPTWNGLHLLRENLPSVLAAVYTYEEKTNSSTEIVIVDDGSSDGTSESLPKEFPEVRLVSRNRNGGFAIACNTGFKHSKNSLIALLNNDVQLEPMYLVHHAKHFRSEDVFSVTAKVFNWEGTHFTTGGRVGRFRRGFWSVYFNYDLISGDRRVADRLEHELLSAYAVGGFATYDREKLDYLGGFNELLSPFHWEDIDLCYRGWKCGWKTLYEPLSRARHRTSATIDAHYRKKKVDEVSFRNRLLFHWINLHAPSFIGLHLLSLLGMILTNSLVLNISFFRSLFSAFRNLGEVRELRKRERGRSLKSDKEIAETLNRFLRSAPVRVYYSLDEILQEHAESR